MATFTGKFKQKTGANTYDILHPATDANVVDYDNRASGLAAQNVQDAIDEIVSSGVGVTGVKGNAESTYRTGQVNLTPANIGAEPAFTDGSATIASVSSNIVTLKAGVTQSGGAIANSSGSDITLAKVAKTGAYSDLSGTPTIGDGTLTIQTEGTAKGTFTANQAGPTTINITAADLGLTSALKFVGVGTTTEPSAGQYIYFPSTPPYYVPITTTGTKEIVPAHLGDVIIIEGKEYLCTVAGAGEQASWEELGDESSFALKTTTISAGTGLTGGGSLAANRTISLADNYGDTKNPYASKTKNYVLAAPANANGAPSFRALTDADMPSGYFSNPMTTAGDIIVGGASGTPTRLAGGNPGQILGSNAAYEPFWQDPTWTSVTLNGTSKSNSTASFYAPESAITTSTAKRYLIGSSSTTSVATENTNASVYMQSGKLYSNNAEVLTGNQTITLSGDATGSGATAITVTLANTGVPAGTYSAVTVNTKGLVTAGGQVLEVINNGAGTTVVTGGWYFEKDAAS